MNEWMNKWMNECLTKACTKIKMIYADYLISKTQYKKTTTNNTI